MRVIYDFLLKRYFAIKSLFNYIFKMNTRNGRASSMSSIDNDMLLNAEDEHTKYSSKLLEEKGERIDISPMQYIKLLPDINARFAQKTGDPIDPETGMKFSFVKTREAKEQRLDLLKKFLNSKMNLGPPA